ncbi:MAG: PAS domain-containing protein [Verrucomicrobia bacterium]|jgi:two-component system CheB/CheR fusion protein|nr:PAS domain-containing protein [Verrucomicrobiota bacterium]
MEKKAEEAAESGVLRRIVGIGASAGGLRALETFFRVAPEEGGCAYIVVQHLSPDFKSLMDDLLARHTGMPIHRVEEPVKLEANAVYLIPPRKVMTVRENYLYLQERDVEKGLEFPINVFFRSLAKDAGTRAVGVILSGTGSDGTEGVRAIAEAGGLVLCQTPESADFDGMPKNAAATGCCHYLLEPGQMPATIQEHAGPEPALPAPIAKESEVLPQGLEDGGEWDPVIKVLYKACGIDFSLYKQTTVERRIHRRMNFQHLEEVPAYAEYLLRNREEVDALYRDLLIGVTEFYRDPEVFAYVEEKVIPELLQRARGNEVRLWVAGCATGEEVYSLAISFEEAIRERGWDGKLSLFATDAHRHSLDTAAAGLYPEDSLRHLGEERLERYFHLEQPGLYRISPDLRRKIVFAPHNVITDPPFTRINFISCRNLLIYLKGEIQERVLRFFHYALNRQGVLLLGTSEGLARMEAGFKRLDARHKVFQKEGSKVNPPGGGRIPDLRGGGNLSRFAPAGEGRMAQIEKDLLQSYDHILDRHVPPGVIINERNEVLHYFGSFSEYLVPESGRMKRDLLARTEGDFRLALSTLLQRARTNEEETSLHGLRLHRDGAEVRGDLSVEPIRIQDSNTFYYYICFREGSGGGAEETAEAETPRETSFEAGEAAQQRIRELEQELQATKENLQATVEELQTSNEELQATNEEMLASNEELQSTNEELHSVNEELYTVNAEFERKNNELLELNQDHVNLLASLDTGIVFVDEQLKIRKFNPAISRSFKILPQDVGRPIEHIAYQLEDQEGMLKDVRSVLSGGETIEKEMQTREGGWIQKRVVPFHGTNKDIEGVVLTFSDITKLKKMETRLGMAMHSTRLVLWEWDLEKDHFSTHAEEGCILGFDLPALERSLRSWLALVHPEDYGKVETSLQRVLDGHDDEWECEHRFRTRTGEWRWMLNVGRVYKRDTEGAALRMIGTTQDIDKRKKMNLEMEELKRRAEEASRAKSDFLAVVSHELRTPLNPILGFIQLLAGEAEGEKLEWMHIIEQSASRLEELIEDILSFVQLDAGQLKVDPSPFKPYDLFATLLEVARARSGNGKVEVTFDPPEGEAEREVHLQGDQRLLRMVGKHLLDNALKFTEEGEVSLRYRMEHGGVTGEDRLVIEVRDTGAGMKAKALEHLKEPFIQLDAGTRRYYQGIGIGLAISWRIVEELKGTFTVDSPPGKGTHIRVDIPCECVEAAQAHPLTKEGAGGLPAKILLVEDNQFNRNLTRIQLHQIGCEVVEAKTGQAALELFREQAFDVVLMDIGIPDISGLQATRAMRVLDEGRQPPSPTRIFAFTADGNFGRGELSDRDLFDGIIYKPVQLVELRRCLCAPAED